MAGSHDSSVIERAKRAFLRMTSPAGFGGDNALFSSAQMMNIPPMIGRSDAAYERILSLVVQDKLDYSRSEEEQKRFFRTILSLSRECERNVKESIELSLRAGKSLPLDELHEYYLGIQNFSCILADISAFHAKISQFRKTPFAAMINRMTENGADPAEFRLAEQEIELYHLLNDYIRENDANATKLRMKIRNLMPKAEQSRYVKAYSEYLKVYAEPEYGTIGEELVSW